jgi:NAD(P)-dependent dehydrogenase (short-subunit alcohol dehydrogenase family)
MATAADLAETVAAVEAEGRRVVAHQADVRDEAGLRKAVDSAVAELGRLDIVCANAAVMVNGLWDEYTQQAWHEVIDTNLTGTWNTIRTTAPHLIRAGGGSLIVINSTAGLKGVPFMPAYVASKHALVGLANAMANELAVHHIRVNTVHPTGVPTTPVLHGSGLQQLIDTQPRLASMFLNGLDVDMISPADVSNAVVYLASEESRYVTGQQLKVDAGMLNR